MMAAGVLGASPRATVNAALKATSKMGVNATSTLPDTTADTSTNTTPVAQAAPRWQRLLPASLFGRLALLLSVAVLLSHGLALTLMFEVLPPPPHPHGPPPMDGAGGPPPMLATSLLLDIAIRLSALLLAAWVGARWLSQPMLKLAQAARELGHNIHRPALAEAGPRECRDAAAVFNRMQAQIREQLSDRDRFVAAVSHDLRTPLTRMRLRIEGMDDERQRAHLARDITEMDQMISATLDCLRGAAAPEAMAPVSLRELMDRLAEDQRACGHLVTVSGRGATVCAQAGALRRCFNNLVDNAVRYGGSAHIALSAAPGAVWIEVSDAGPGLPPDELDRVLAPFYRVEASRSRHTGGVGLGLSIAQEIALRHGGSLSLSNADPHGLKVTVRLPWPG
ncbi:MAG: hypothetical protein RJA98_1914 [Pseudomonadota bacterium]|jgi:protein-histidine pros-kinase